MSDDAQRPSVNPKRLVRRGYDDVAGAYLAERATTGRERELVEAFAADLQADSRVLDAGCGAGVPVTAAVVDSGHRVVGMDAAREQLRLASERVRAPLVQGDLTRLPFAEDSFDALISLHAIIHVPREEHAAVLAEFARVLGPGGRNLVSTGTGPWEGTNTDWLDAGGGMFWSFYGRERNRELLADAGFAVDSEDVIDDEIGGGEFLFVRGCLE